MKWLKWELRAALALVVLLAAGAGWLLGTESGLRWALGFAPPELEIEGARGALIGEITAERVSHRDLFEARQVALQLNLLSLAADTISVEFARVESLRIRRPASSPDTSSSKFPFRIRVADAAVKSLVFEGYEIHDLRADYTGSGSGHEAQASFSAAGARARLKAVLGAELSVDAEIQGLNLAAIDPAAPQTALQVRLAARGNASALAGTLAAAAANPGPLDRERLPFKNLDVAFSTDFKTIQMQSIKAALHPAGTLQGKGTASLEHAQLQIRVSDLDLRGLWSTLRQTRLAGPLELDLARERQRVKGTLAQQDMSLAADAERSGDDIEVRALRARAGESEATGTGRVRLGEPLKFSADLRLARFDPSRFGDYPAASINGSLKANGDLGGSGSASWEIADSRLLGQELASRGAARLDARRISGADAWVTLGANRATAKGAFGGPGDRFAWTLQVPELAALAAGFGGEIRARGTAGGTWEQPHAAVDAQAARLRLTEALVFERAAVKAAGTLQKHEGDVTAQGAQLDFSSKLRGGWSKGAWRGEIVSLRNTGAYPLELKTPAALEAGPARVALGRFEAELAGGRAAVESARWEQGRLASSGSIAALPVQWLLTALRIEKAAGDLALDGDWSLASTPRLNGRLTVRRAGGDLAVGGVQAEISNLVAQASFAENRVAARADIAARMGSARVEGTLAGLSRESALAFTAEIEAAELRSLTEPLWTQARLTGRASATLRGAGTLAKPQLSGTLRGDALGFEMPLWGVTLRDGRVRAELEANRLRVTEARIAGGDGSFSASGTLPLAFADGAATLEWRAERLGVLARPDRRLVVSGKGVTSFDGKRFGLIGELRAESGHFEALDDSLPQLEDDVVITGRKENDPRASPRRRGPLPLDLDLKLDLGSRLTLRAHGFDGGVAGQVHVTTTTAGEPLANGRVRAVRATFRAYGQELQVDPGELVFSGPVDNPGLDISAWRRHQQVEAGVRVTGSIQTPYVELISNPPVSESEKLSWLVLGRAPTEVSGADLALLQAAGGALFGRGGKPPVTKRLATRLGFDELTVRGSSELSSNVLALGKRYSDRLYLSFEQAIGTTTEYLAKLDYALTQRLSLRGQTGTTSGVGFFYRYSWD